MVFEQSVLIPSDGCRIKISDSVSFCSQMYKENIPLCDILKIVFHNLFSTRIYRKKDRIFQHQNFKLI